MEILYELFEMLDMSPNMIETILNFVKVLPALPIMFLMWAVVYVVFIGGLMLGFDFEQIEGVTDAISGIGVMAMEFVCNLFGISM